MQLTPLGKFIFLDRYSQKDLLGPLTTGQEVLCRLDDGTKVIGVVNHVPADSTGKIEVVAPDGGCVSRYRDQIDVPKEGVFEALQRVAVASAQGDAAFATSILDQMASFKFIPAGRILESLGNTNSTTTGYNCFVLPCPHDSRAGICHTLSEMSELMCKGGGVGINYSSLRPRGSYVRKVNGRSSGAVSWLELFSFMTNLVIQGGSRRGAQMAMLAVHHPDIEEFIQLKQDNTRATGCNMSVVISDAFMGAVIEDADWDLVHPQTDHPEYDTCWDGDLEAWKAAGRPVRVWRTVKAKYLWDLIISSAHASGEPGLWFEGVANRDRPSGPKLIATNPCGEQGLPGYGVCNLGHIVLPAFVKANVWATAPGGSPFDLFDLVALRESVTQAVRFLDSVIDVTHYPLKETRLRQQEDRRIGLGTLGLGEALIRLGLRYGSEEASDFCNAVYSEIALVAYETSMNLVKSGKRASVLDRDQFQLSAIGERIREVSPGLYTDILNYGIANVCLLTQAPTGTVGTMLNTSTGIEPYFDFTWTRASRLGVHTETIGVVSEYRTVHPTGDLPAYFVTAQQLHPSDHVNMQATVQRWTDASISKTINCPNHWTVADVAEVYHRLWESGCKGGTVYRDGCRDVQVLTPVANTNTTTEDNPTPPHNVGHKPPKVYPPVRQSITASKVTPGGTLHVHLTKDADGDPLEVFCEAGKSGSEIGALMEAMGRILSLTLRIQDEPPSVRLWMIIEQLMGIGGSHGIGLGPKRVLSTPDGIGQALLEAVNWQSSHTGNSVPIAENPKGRGRDVCPSCQNISLVREGGCEACQACGYSRC